MILPIVSKKYGSKSPGQTGTCPKKILSGSTRSLSAARIVKFSCLISIILAICTITPALAGTKYMAGSPDLQVHIEGTNEFSPGDEFDLRLNVENTGLNTFKIAESGLIDPPDLSSTAKHLTADMEAGNVPVIIKADPQVLGDLLANGSVTAQFHIKILQDAPAGIYQIPVTLHYTYLYQQEQTGLDTLAYRYKDTTKTVNILIRIRPAMQIMVSVTGSSKLTPEIEGYIILTIQNTGSEDGRNATVRILASNKSPFTPTEGSEYIGDFNRGVSTNCRFNLLVSRDAEEKNYPLDIVVHYKNSDGDYVDTKTETIGISVGRKVSFNATPVSASLVPGTKSVLTVQYGNTGGTTVYDAQARIHVLDPFTSNDDTAYLGTMSPGDVREVGFIISTDSAAAVKEYGLDSEITYRDSFNNELTSDPVKVNVRAVPLSSIITGKTGLPLIPIGLCMVLVVVIAYYFRRRKSAPK